MFIIHNEGSVQLSSVQSLSCVWLFVTWWTITHQFPLSRAFFRKEYWTGLSCPPSGDLPNPRIESRSLALQADSLLSEPPGKPKNTGVGSLSLPQGIFLTQESNRGLLHCRRILYQMNDQGSPSVLPNFRQICSWIEEALEKHPHPGRGMKTLPSVRSLWHCSVTDCCVKTVSSKKVTRKPWQEKWEKNSQ